MTAFASELKFYNHQPLVGSSDSLMYIKSLQFNVWTHHTAVLEYLKHTLYWYYGITALKWHDWINVTDVGRILAKYGTNEPCSAAQYTW